MPKNNFLSPLGILTILFLLPPFAFSADFASQAQTPGVSGAGEDSSDKIEITKDKHGREVIRITGQKLKMDHDQEPPEAAGLQKSKINIPESSYRRVTIPSVALTASEFRENGALWHTLKSPHFSVEIEDNKIFGMNTAELLEGFSLLMKEELSGWSSGAGTNELVVKIFKGRTSYEDFCKNRTETTKHDCSPSLGYTEYRYRMTGDGRYSRVVWTRVLFYWEEDWRKLWGLEAKYSKRIFFMTLFHEASHQQLATGTRRVIPKWLDEGLAVYFSNAFFNGKEVYLPQKGINDDPDNLYVKKALQRGTETNRVFYWKEQVEDDNFFYPVAGSFVTFLMRTPEYRHYVDDALAMADRRASMEEIADFFIKKSDPQVFQSWHERCRKTREPFR